MLCSWKEAKDCRDAINIGGMEGMVWIVTIFLFLGIAMIVKGESKSSKFLGYGLLAIVFIFVLLLISSIVVKTEDSRTSDLVVPSILS